MDQISIAARGHSTRFTTDQLNKVRDFYIKHNEKKWKDEQKQSDLEEVMQATGLSEKQIYTFCRNKKSRDKYKQVHRSPICKPLKVILKELQFDRLISTSYDGTPAENIRLHGTDCYTGNSQVETSGNPFQVTKLSFIGSHSCDKYRRTLSVHLDNEELAQKRDGESFNPLTNHFCDCLPVPENLRL